MATVSGFSMLTIHVMSVLGSDSLLRTTAAVVQRFLGAGCSGRCAVLLSLAGLVNELDTRG
jgi:hypothetical protein